MWNQLSAEHYLVRPNFLHKENRFPSLHPWAVKKANRLHVSTLPWPSPPLPSVFPSSFSFPQQLSFVFPPFSFMRINLPLHQESSSSSSRNRSDYCCVFSTTAIWASGRKGFEHLKSDSSLLPPFAPLLHSARFSTAVLPCSPRKPQLLPACLSFFLEMWFFPSLQSSIYHEMGCFYES